MNIIAISNQKGGTGKTATAHNLGAALAAAGLRILLIDSDPQASLTRACGVDDSSGGSLAEVLGGSSPGKLTLPQVIRKVGPGLDLVPADIALATAELGLTSRLGRESILKRALGSLSGYDLALIDCGPSLGLLTVGALCAADAVLIPTQPQAQDLRGLSLFLDTIKEIKAELNPGLELLGVIVTFYDSRLTHHKQALETIKRADLPILATLGRSVKVAEAAGAGQPVLDYDPANPQSENYKQLAEYIKQWQQLKSL